MKELEPILLRTHYGQYRPGTTAWFLPEVAKRLVDQGWADRVQREPVTEKTTRESSVKARTTKKL